MRTPPVAPRPAAAGRRRLGVRLGFVPALLTALLSPAFAQEDPDLKIGRELYAAGKFEAALGGFKAVIAARPDKLEAYAAAGRCLIALGRTGEAIDLLLEAEARPRPPAEVLSVLGQAYYWDGARRLARTPPGGDRSAARSQFLNAAIYCSKAAGQKADLDEAFYFLGLAKLQSGQAGAAAAAGALSRAAALRPDHPTYLEKLGEALQLQGRFREAAAAYERAVRATPPRFKAYRRDTWARAGECAGRAGEVDRALAAFRAAFELAPDHAPTFQRIWNAFGTGKERQRDGVRVLQALAGVRPDSALPPYYLGFFLKALGEDAAARRAWEACLKTEAGKSYPEAWARVAEYRYFDEGNEDGAVACCEKALALDARNARAFTLLQTLVSKHYRARQWVEAENLTRKLLEARPENGLEWSNLALFLTKQRRYREAWWAFEKALHHAPDKVQVLNAAAILLQFSSIGVTDPQEEARKLYERALQLEPDSLLAMENLGMIYAERGRLDKARKLLETVVRRDPGRGVAMRELNKVLQKLRARPAGVKAGGSRSP